MREAAVTSRGRVTIPAEIRRRVALETGDRVAFAVLPNGSAVMRAKKRSISELAGSVEPAVGARVPVKRLGLDY